MTACAVWLRRRYLLDHGHTPAEPRCDHPNADCPPTSTQETR